MPVEWIEIDKAKSESDIAANVFHYCISLQVEIVLLHLMRCAAALLHCKSVRVWNDIVPSHSKNVKTMVIKFYEMQLKTFALTIRLAHLVAFQRIAHHFGL